MAGLFIGDVARRTGLAVSAIRFYEEQGLVRPDRNASGQRVFARSDLRRLSFVLIAQKLGFTLKDIEQALSSLPNQRTPTRSDWAELSRSFRAALDERITGLESLRDRLDQCIGCGCLSLEICDLHNPNDVAAKDGVGPRFLSN